MSKADALELALELEPAWMASTSRAGEQYAAIVKTIANAISLVSGRGSGQV